MVEKNAKEFKYMKFSTLRDLGTGFLGFLFYLSLSVVLILNFRPLYVYEMKSENLASVSSMTEAEILEEYERPDPLQFPFLPGRTYLSFSSHVRGGTHPFRGSQKDL